MPQATLVCTVWGTGPRVLEWQSLGVLPSKSNPGPANTSKSVFFVGLIPSYPHKPGLRNGSGITQPPAYSLACLHLKGSSPGTNSARPAGACYAVPGGAY